MIVRSFLLVFSLLTATFSGSAYGAVGIQQIRQSVDSHMAVHIDDLMEQYGPGVRVEYSIGSLDPRISMADCPAPLQVAIRSARSIGRINVRVSCQAESLWSLYVPAEVKLYRPIVSTNIPLARGTTINASHLQLREQNISGTVGSYFTEIEQVVGMLAKYPLRANAAITAKQLQTPLMIKRGESVLMTAHSGSLVVKIPGTALMDGHEGEQISVRNQQSRRTVDARVVAPGQVSVAM